MRVGPAKRESSLGGSRRGGPGRVRPAEELGGGRKRRRRSGGGRDPPREERGARRRAEEGPPRRGHRPDGLPGTASPAGTAAAAWEWAAPRPDAAAQPEP